MVSLLWGVIAASLGLLVYLVPPVLGPVLPAGWRERIGDFYYKQSLRSFEAVAFVRRLLGGYELLPIGVNDEQKLAQVVLSSGIVSDDKTMPFNDPDGRIARLWTKQIAVVFEDVPAAIDAELAEVAHWYNRKTIDGDVTQPTDGARADGGGEVEQVAVDPYIPVPNVLRAVDPMDALSLVTKGVEPENIETTKQLTIERRSGYKSAIGMTEVMTFTGFAFGLGGIAAVEYFRKEILDKGGGGGGGGAQPPIPLGQLGVHIDMVALPIPVHRLVDLVGVVV